MLSSQPCNSKSLVSHMWSVLKFEWFANIVLQNFLSVWREFLPNIRCCSLKITKIDCQCKYFNGHCYARNSCATIDTKYAFGYIIYKSEAFARWLLNLWSNIFQIEIDGSIIFPRNHYSIINWRNLWWYWTEGLIYK